MNDLIHVKWLMRIATVKTAEWKELMNEWMARVHWQLNRSWGIFGLSQSHYTLKNLLI